MVTELFRHQRSMAYYDNNRSGCMWGLFKFLGMHKHMHPSKMLSYRDANHKAGSESLTLGQYDISVEKEPMLNKKSVTQMESKECAKKKSSGASYLINLLYKKVIKKKNKKLKLSSSSRLLRTLSIHHLECNDYVLPNSSVSNTHFPIVDLNSNELVSSENENIHQPLRHTKGSPFDKQQIKDAIKENIKMEYLITLDGVLDKIPIDQKMNGEMQGVNRSKFGSEGYVNTNSRLAKRTIQRSRSLTESLEKYSDTLEDHASRLSLNSVNNRDNTFTNKRTLRSNSLTESFEIYSRLLESVSLKDNQQHYRRLSSVKEHDDVYTHKRTTRSRSLSGSLDVYSRILESVSTIEYKKQPERLRSVKEENVTSNSELGSFSLDNNALNEISLQSTEKNDSDLIVDGMKSDGLLSNVEQREERIEKSETHINEGQNDISPKPTPASVLDFIVDEDPVSPIYTCNEVAKQQSSWIYFEEHDESESTHHIDTPYSFDNSHNLSIEDLEFNYVKKVLMSSRFCEGLNEFLSAWYSSYEPGDQLLFVDEESIKDEIFSNMALDHRLYLLDLINEILMEFYERTVASITGLSRYSASVKPLFVGDHLIKDVWKRVEWHLTSQNDVWDTLESEENRYFAKADGWINLLFDVERVGTEMEGLILDELVDDCFVCLFI